MAHITEDRVAESTTTTGTGALTLAGALTGFRTFSSVMTSPSDTCWYALWAVDASGNTTGDFECGLGTYSAANTLTSTWSSEGATQSGAAAVTFLLEVARPENYSLNGLASLPTQVV